MVIGVPRETHWRQLAFGTDTFPASARVAFTTADKFGFCILTDIEVAPSKTPKAIEPEDTAIIHSHCGGDGVKKIWKWVGGRLTMTGKREGEGRRVVIPVTWVLVGNFKVQTLLRTNV